MRHLYLFFAMLILTACSKEDTFGPWNLKNGQEVEVSVGHQYGAVNDDVLLLPQNKPAEMSLYYFTDREPGFTYRVRAKMVAEKVPPQDGPAYYLEYIETLGKERYNGNESFELELIQSYIPAGPMIVLFKKDGKYFLDSKIQLTYNNDEVEDQLEEIWENREEIRQNAIDKVASLPRWKSIRATVSHDPANFGREYLIHSLKFLE